MPAERITSRNPWHLLLVIDDSGSMAGEGARMVNEVMELMIEEMKLLSQGTKPYFKISVIKFGSGSQVLAEAVSEQAVNINTVTQFSGSSGTTNAAAGLREAYQILSRNGGNPEDFDPFVFFLSDGHPDSAPAARTVADEIKALQVPAGRPRIVTVGVGSVDESFMSDIATHPEMFKKYDGVAGIKALMPDIGTVASAAKGAEGLEKSIMRL